MDYFLGGWDADGKGPNVWDNVTHEKTSFIIDGSNGDISCDSYHKYKEDILLLKEMGANFYRFSISWPRVLPTGILYSLSVTKIPVINFQLCRFY